MEQGKYSSKFPFITNFLFPFFIIVNCISLCAILVIIKVIAEFNSIPILSYGGFAVVAILIAILCFQIAFQEFFKVFLAIEKNTDESVLVMREILNALQNNDSKETPPPLPNMI